MNLPPPDQFGNDFNKAPGGAPMGWENPEPHGFAQPPGYLLPGPSCPQAPPPPYDYPRQQLPGHPGYPGHPSYAGPLMGPNPEAAYPPGPREPPGANAGQPQPPQSMQPQGYLMVPNVTVVQQPLRTPDPVAVTCPSCQQPVVTKTSTYPGLLAWLIVGGLFLAGLVLLIPLLFCFVPLCVPSCHDVRHRCPNCKANIYTYTRM
ncbi:lipopolysaccharide-induced tumor necrosis factor-alpha factor homolog [Lethenteron reissneri]|uniref:lipopolysaccharide-induced tumor necrosis factor-alpha factor homolog n=1 Tax=Lethenteron reissneri TaxID=7753 RepID=UPI002AB6AD49|nr:lipopolysaccharide-induced tumor necrosis factor-alpha factor homolog [Lethenteron reissneri]